MTPEIPQSPSKPVHRFRRTVAAAVAAVSFAGLAGCDTSVGIPNLGGINGTADLQPGPCAAFLGEKPAPKKIDAQRCADFIRGGQIVLVNFGETPATAKAVAQGIQDTLKASSDGVFTPTVTAIEASSAASSQVKQTPDCLEPRQSLAGIAAHTMDLQKKYDVVVALSSKGVCDQPALGGLVPPGNQSNIADIYDHSGPGDPNKIPRLVTVGSHELGHTAGVEHAGATGIKTIKPNGEKSYTYQTFTTPQKSPFDLLGYVYKNSYLEYGEGTSYMGGYDPAVQKEGPVLNALQQDILREPLAAATGDPKEIKSIPIGPDGLSIKPQDAKQGRYGIIDLTQYVTLEDHQATKDTGLAGGPKAFGQLAVVPSSGPVPFVNLYLTAKEQGVHGFTDVVATIRPSAGPVTLTWAGQTFKISAGLNGGAQVKVVA